MEGLGDFEWGTLDVKAEHLRGGVLEVLTTSKVNVRGRPCGHRSRGRFRGRSRGHFSWGQVPRFACSVLV